MPPLRTTVPVGQVAVPEGLDSVLAKATDPDRGYETVAELVLGWRAAVGQTDGPRSPLGSDRLGR